MIKLLCSPTH